jgi:hypothetical protein
MTSDPGAVEPRRAKRLDRCSSFMPRHAWRWPMRHRRNEKTATGWRMGNCTGRRGVRGGGHEVPSGGIRRSSPTGAHRLRRLSCNPAIESGIAGPNITNGMSVWRDRDGEAAQPTSAAKRTSCWREARGAAHR